MENKLVIFVCSGNTCRSPMAAAFFIKGLAEKNIGGIDVISRGLGTEGGEPATGYAAAAVSAFGCDISGHRSAPLTLDEADRACLIACMTEGHAFTLTRAGIPSDKIVVMGIPDPFGGDSADYERCALKIRDGLDKIYEKLGI